MKRVLIVCALLLAPLSAQAHPCFVGMWTASLPCPGVATYDFGPPVLVATGVWKGCFQSVIGGQLQPVGMYELRMWSDKLGTISIREGTRISTSVGTVDLSKKEMVFLNTTYTH